MAPGTREDVSLTAVGHDGVETELRAAGLRLPLSAETWCAVDFKPAECGSVTISLAVRARGYEGRRLPRLGLFPRAGNQVSVEIAAREPAAPRELEVLAVSHEDLPGTPREMLGRARSGDPLGDHVLEHGPRRPVPARTFPLRRGTYGTVQLSFAHEPGVALAAMIGSELAALPAPGEAFEVLALIIEPHAANLVSFVFVEIESGPLA